MTLKGLNYTREHYHYARWKCEFPRNIRHCMQHRYSRRLFIVSNRRVGAFLEVGKYLSLHDDAMWKGRAWKWQLKSQRDPRIYRISGGAYSWHEHWIFKKKKKKINISFDSILRWRTKRWIDRRRKNLENYNSCI